MKKRYLAIILCCAAILLCGCKKGERVAFSGTKYQRISFDGESLGEDLDLISDSTAVINELKQSYPTQIPIYEIKERPITEEEYRLMEEQLGIEKWYWEGYEDGKIHGLIAPYTDPVRGYYYTLGLTDEELEELAWETFNKIPFMEGEYEYVGISSTMEIGTDDGYDIASVTVSFAPLLDGVRVVGSSRCDLSFDATGLQEIYITLFDYEEIGTMDMIPLEEATARIKTPDAFSLKTSNANIETLEVERIKLLLVNQYSRGCTILQPIYNFIGFSNFYLTFP